MATIDLYNRCNDFGKKPLTLALIDFVDNIFKVNVAITAAILTFKDLDKLVIFLEAGLFYNLVRSVGGVTGSESVRLLRRISLTAEPIKFSITVKVPIGPEEFLELFLGRIIHPFKRNGP